VLLALDIGNTDTVIGVFADVTTPRSAERVSGELADLVHHWRISTIADRTFDELALVLIELVTLANVVLPRRGVPNTELGDAVIDGIAASSSVPAVTTAVRKMVARWFDVPLVVVEPGIKMGMPILYDNPREVGADRIVNSVGALDLFGGPAIVVDLGTATTFDVISAAGEYL
jgi:type III pantothenate kinase